MRNADSLVSFRNNSEKRFRGPDNPNMEVQPDAPFTISSTFLSLDLLGKK